MSERITSIPFSDAMLRRYYDYDIRLKELLDLGLPGPVLYAFFTSDEMIEYQYLHILYCLDLRLNHINFDDLPF